MKKQVKSIALVLGALVLVGCGDSHEAAMNDMIASMEKLNTILDGVQDEASAKAAKPKIEALSKQMDALGQRMEKLGEPSEAQQKELTAKFGKKMEKLGPKMIGNMMRISMNPQFAEHLQEAMKGMNKRGPSIVQ